MAGSGDRGGTSLDALTALRARIASLNGDGVVVWMNAAWSRQRQSQVGDTIVATATGVDYVAVCRRARGPSGVLLAEAIRAVLAGSTSYVDLDGDFAIGSDRRTQVSVTPAPAGARGALVTQLDVRASNNKPASEPPERVVPRTLEVLTPRERAVLTLMARGLENHAIADELRVGYATVRSHVRSLMAKVGARSRLEAVVRAVQLDLVTLPRADGANAPTPEDR